MVENGIPILASLEEQRQPLLENDDKQIIPPHHHQKPQKTPMQRAIRKTFKLTAHLANLLPTGSVLAFQILSPVFSHEGNCRTSTSQNLTLVLLGVCGFSCFILSFTDSFRDERGKVWYGLATFRGMWIIDGTISLPDEQAKRYRLRLIDFFHAFLSALVFSAVAFLDHNVVACLLPMPSEEAKELLSTMPIAIGVICSLLFVALPTTRHGIGFPLSRF